MATKATKVTPQFTFTNSIKFVRRLVVYFVLFWNEFYKTFIAFVQPVFILDLQVKP